ncbi:toll/interleukin-1 receptor domain-containing protein [Magnetospirillum fulvum]|uniref:toll/interleukin-1 receptor domain-containing protein n=1 Tax=Magnetospirillum fulvum TaxID=1082 RepID=UPI00068758D5|nr:toll/interleukin-1 receptor domain-containing protein [Magnetospirillum fulvum]
MTTFALPPKTHAFLRRLRTEYDEEGNSLLVEIIDFSRILVVPGTDYDNWNGGTYGHDVRIFLPERVLGKIRVREQQTLCEKLCEDLNACSQSYPNEHFRAVTIEGDDETDPEARQAVPLGGRPNIDPNSLAIWQPGQIRLFISHRDIHKAEAKTLGEALANYGISSFVAHDTIQPMTTWRSEILKGLETMEVMVAFLTEGFHDSIWTNQEVGYALGRNVPVISLKMATEDPKGFIGDVQAVKGRLSDPDYTAAEVYKVLAERLGNRERLQGALLTAFVAAPDFTEAKNRFDRMAGVVGRLSDDELRQIIEGFRGNDQLHNAVYLTSKYERLRHFLERATGKKFRVEGRKISQLFETDEDLIPF